MMKTSKINATNIEAMLLVGRELLGDKILILIEEDFSFALCNAE